MTQAAEELRLTESQLEAVNALKGPLLVMAPVGSGKTTVLAHRLAAAHRSGFPAERCLSITFTNRAARELKQRITALDPELARSALFTFHSFCAMVLREECEAAGLPVRFLICDDQDSEQILENRRPDEAHAPGSAKALYYRWSRALSRLEPERCLLNRIPREALAGWTPEDRSWISAYLNSLRERDAVDFPLLVYTVRALFNEDTALRTRWEQRYEWIQVDEVQDTHLSEWHLLECLATGHGNLAFFGDLDQTIYGWRGSAPRRLLEHFEQRFGDVRRVMIDLNQRGTRQILELADHVARGLPQRHTHIKPAGHLPEGTPARWIIAPTPRDAYRLLAKDVARTLAADPDATCAVLARGHQICKQAGMALESEGLQPLLEEDLKLGRKPEIRSLFAALRLVVQSEDVSAFGRLLRWSGYTKEQQRVLGLIRKHSEETSLQPVDLLAPDSLQHGDPFHRLIDSWEQGDYVVLDVESTGLDTDRDDVIEIACQRWSRDVELDRFHVLLRTTHGLGGSQAVHGITPERLEYEGRDPAEVYTELKEYLGDTLVIGHNIDFDLAILRSHASRLGIQLPHWHQVDTLRLARRLVPGGSMRLGDLALRLKLAHRPTHRAMDDVSCTAELLRLLVGRLLESREDRQDALREAMPVFRQWNQDITKLNELGQVLRPHELAAYILAQEWFRGGFPDGMVPVSLKRFLRWIEVQDNEDHSRAAPADSLARILHAAALAQASDHLMGSGIPVLTIHAAKGMEFDHVWLAGLTRGILPDGRNLHGEKLDEERRLCYVAITRARRSFRAVAWDFDDRGRSAGWSEFVRELAGKDTG